MKKILLLLCIAILSSCSAVDEQTETKSEAKNIEYISTGSVVMTGGMDHSMDEEFAPQEDETKKSLSDSPRHQEWVEIDNNGKTIHAFVVYPENKEKSSTVILIHENKGLNDWARSMADQVAAEGYIVVTPDLLSSFDEEKSKTSDFASPDDATQALYSLKQEDINSDLASVSEYAQSIESYNGNLVSAGFCWGGSQSFNLASQNKDLKAALVFYGTAPKDTEPYSQINVPVYAFYGENDDRVNATIEDTKTSMSENEKTFEYEIYPGAGHAFMRNAQSSGADEATIEARNSAFERMKTILSTYK